MLKVKLFFRVMAHLLILRPFMWLFTGINIEGREHLNDIDQFIIISNHNSHLDIILLLLLLPCSAIPKTHPIAEKEYFSKNKIVFAMVKFLFDPIWIVRGKPDLTGDPFYDIKQKIDLGHNVIIFPEGTRGKPGEMQSFKSGIGRLVSQYPQLPIVPVFLAGPEKALPKSSSILLPFWCCVTIGPPRIFKGHHREITKLLENELVLLSHSDMAVRHKRQSKKSPPQTIAFLGIDGSGKSTLSKMVAETISKNSSVCYLSDDTEFFEDGSSRPIQPFITEKIRGMLSAYAKRAKSLKLYKVPKLAELLLRNHLCGDMKKWYHPDFIVMDGCPLLNMAAWAALYKKDKLNRESCAAAIRMLAQKGEPLSNTSQIFSDFPELLYLKKLRLEPMVLPDIVIFLDVPPPIAINRINSRGESKQVHETEEKLNELRNAYLLVCDVIKTYFNIPTYIDSALDNKENTRNTSLKFIRDALLKERK